MKALIVHSPWIGGVFDHFSEALESNGHVVRKIVYKRQKSALRLIKIHNIPQIHSYLERKSWDIFNHNVLQQDRAFSPDIFISMNQSFLLPNTIKKIKSKGCRTVSFVGDNPFDSHRYSYFPIALRYFDIIFVTERSWIPSIRNVAPHAKIIKIVSGGGFNKSLFSPVDENNISEDEKTKLSCDISFTGESYGMRGEGGYRSGILDQLGSYNVKIWGDERWKLRFPYYDNLEKAYQGGRLPFDTLRKLYHLSTINLNMPSPQVITGFQSRVFEIAACKGFQIVDWRELDEIFTKDELVTFKNIPDLLEKVDFFIHQPEKRQPYIDKLYKKVWFKHTWQLRAEEMIKMIRENL